ncbi:hypothetical protein SERLA73DRAFT_76402 [Serpula lacrymans var. lacrymans S7.3]|uniref:Fungal-type protein kinase domain-containing protein n=2 Tax=Serpula lacrymans var. lacrymans TaxID=341189 RepID=F8Q5G9_SERL3|nr:uncharacterized protein SERLADRAFT_441218 [Serpula lacrymans var. lacrymans S7.9]EGN96440.1 hypothetical protein SERLA73DRAFT_76402 [Serpula lacrymans var. lacrymans S7.3]EGO21988.1 hypothetical protein SERLADRAFT_441218 [Serpula lacrymans var. lacrymans S7.9]
MIFLRYSKTGWLGYDHAMYYDNEGVPVFHVQQGAATLLCKVVAILFKPTGLLGRATRVMVAEVSGDGPRALEDPDHVIIKDCWFTTGTPSNSNIHDKLEDLARDPFFVGYNPNNSTPIFHFPDNHTSQPLASFNDIILAGHPDVDALYDRANTGWDDIHFLSGIPIRDHCLSPSLTLVPSIAHPQTLIQDTTKVIMSATGVSELAELAALEDHTHHCMAMKTVGVELVWFSCVREMLDGIIGVLLGLQNGHMRRGFIHCDVSNGNSWLRVKAALPHFAVPDWPVDISNNWYPQRPGVLGDWAMAENVQDGDTVRTTRYLTGIYPYQAIGRILQPEVPHNYIHNLESVFWMLWLIMINCKGPYCQQIDWVEKEKETAAAEVDKAPASLKHSVSQKQKEKGTAFSKRSASQKQKGKGTAFSKCSAS